MKRTIPLAAVVFLTGCGAGGPGHAPSPPPFEPLPRAEALAPGDTFPPLRVEGWLGMPPPRPGGGPKLHLYDVWAYWCPYCGTAAPSLTKLHEKFAPRGVAFVSVTNTGRESVEAFSRQNKITWSSGYGVPTDAVIPMGASSAMGPAGYEIAPVVYLVGPDSKVLWSDKQARLRHANPAEWEKDIEAALEAALAKNP